MAYNSVYQSLQELFPQIDARALKAVSIEHSKDIDAAVEVVLEEIIPFFTEKSRPSSPLSRSICSDQLSNEAVSAAQTMDSSEKISLISVNDRNQPSYDVNNGTIEPFYDTYDGQHEVKGSTSELTLPDNFVENGMNVSANVHSNGEIVTLNDQYGLNICENEVFVERERSSSDGKCQEDSAEMLSDKISCHKPGSLEDVNMGVNHILDLVQESEDFDAQTLSYESKHGKSATHRKDSVCEQTSRTAQIPAMTASESSTQLLVLPNGDRTNFENLEVSLPSDTIETTEDSIGVEGEYTMIDTITQSGQISIMDDLEEIIADARNNKKTLFSAMQSVISMMREVELREQAVEQAKEESTKGAISVLNKVEELKQILKHAQEANDMHAGEVYGEKAILAAELRELQSRVIFLSDERDKSLAVLDEMRQSLELRFAAAEDEIKGAEEEQLKNEESARKALAEEEMVMERVMQESNILKQQAEENAKLREFLMDRGRVVDVLQGEIAVICQDVKLLKEKFDERVPLSKSLSASQTSCLLASSTSSSKSLIPDQLDRQDDLIKSKQNVNPLSQVSVGIAPSYDRKALLDDGWDFFDKLED